LNIQLKEIEIRNFKGIKEKKINFEKVTNILGANETGKTTIFDAFTWLLFGKDSQNKTDFEIKPLDKDNNVLHGLESSVKGLFLVDGQELLLQRILKEKWTTPRGQAEAIFSGNETSYFLDEVPVKMKDFKDKINSLIQEETFRLVSDPSAFNTILGWKERRNIIFEMCGDVSDEEVIKSNKNLKELQSVIADRSLEDEKARIQSIKKNLKKDKEQIAPRIDEVHRGLPDISNIDFEALNKERTREKEKLNDITTVINRQFEIATKVDEINKKIREIERNRDYQFEQKRLELTREKDKEITNLKDSIYNFEIAIPKTEKLIEQSNNNVEVLKAERQNLLTAYQAQKGNIAETENMVFGIDLSNICPTCGQFLPEEDIASKEAEYCSNFEKERNYKLEKLEKEMKEIISSGSAIKEELEKEEKSISTLTLSLEQLKRDRDIFTEKLKVLEKEKSEILTSTVIEITVEGIQELEKEKETLIKELESLALANREEIESKINNLAYHKQYISFALP
jgi:DNA repair exonuclease SbcCD ATPase subunit